MDHKTIIEGLGGHKGVATALGVTETTVYHWKYRGIPPYYWDHIVSIARRKSEESSLDIETLRAGRIMKRHRS